MKTCVSCGKPKPLAEYYRDGRYLDNPPRAACKTCINARQRATKIALRPTPKACSKCGVTKPPHEFLRESRHADGLRSECRDCFYSERKSERDLAWMRANGSKRKIYNQRARPARDAWTKQWKKEHPEHVRMQDARKRAKRLSSSDVRDLTREQWNALKAAYHSCCAYCGEQRQRLTMDHVVPLGQGGAHTMANVVPACGPCNARKKNRVWQPALVFHH